MPDLQDIEDDDSEDDEETHLATEVWQKPSIGRCWSRVSHISIFFE
jgi:hypothetical protein